MNWTQLKVNCNTQDLDKVSAIMSMVDNSLLIEDYSDIEENLMTIYGELIDESILLADKSKASVSVFLPPEQNAMEILSNLKLRFETENIEVSTEVIGVNMSDWENEWKKYYKPLRIGENIVIVPAWEKFEQKDTDVVVRMDPGMAFGTGTHETTRLCMALLEKHIQKDLTVLDIGTGSGILSICASKLGANCAYAYDIDPVAVKVANENIKDNNITNVVCGVSDLLKNVLKVEGGYDLVLANIVADIILRMAPDVSSYMKTGGKLVTSGIIETQAENVKDVLLGYGFVLDDKLSENDWVAFVFKKV